MTEDRMRKSGLYSAQAIKSIVTYCNRFPEALVRQGNGWKSPCQMLPSNFYDIVGPDTLLKKTALEAVEVSGQCQWVLCDHWWVHHRKACRVGKATWGYWGGGYLSLSGWWPRWWTLPWLVAVGIQINSPPNPNSPKKETHAKYIYIYIKT